MSKLKPMTEEWRPSASTLQKMTTNYPEVDLEYERENLSTITLAMERLEQIGTQVLECGSDVALNTNNPMKAKGILQQVPERFRIEGVESLELRSQEIADKLIVKSNDFVLDKEIDESAMAMIDVFAQTMHKATHRVLRLLLNV